MSRWQNPEVNGELALESQLIVLLIKRRSGFGSPDHSHKVIAKFFREVGDLHAFRYQDLTGEDGARRHIRLTRHGEGNPAILALLVPAKAAVRNGIRTDVLESAQAGILLRDLECLAQNRDVDQRFVVPKKRIFHLVTASAGCVAMKGKKNISLGWIQWIAKIVSRDPSQNSAIPSLRSISSRLGKLAGVQNESTLKLLMPR